MFAPDPRLARKISLGVSSLSHSAASAVSNSINRLPVWRRMADLSLGRGGLGLGEDAHVVFRESRDFLERVASSKTSSARSGVLTKLMKTWHRLISPLFWIWIWANVELDREVWEGLFEGVCAAAT